MRSCSMVHEVTVEDLDELEHVNNIRYLHWVQEISKKHWQLLADRQTQREVVWVVRNHDISYLQAAFLGDTLELTTFVEDVKGPLSIRVVEFKNRETRKLLVRARTQWCLLDAATLKPKRIPESISVLFQLK